MAGRAGYFIAGTVLGLVLGTAVLVTRADEVDAATVAAAVEAGVDPVDLQGAVNATRLPPRVYLAAVGELEHPPPQPQPPPPYDWRVACIESRESGGANVANRRGSGAVGVLQFMPSTFAAHAIEMGHFDWSAWVPWQARAVAAHDLAMGRRRQWSVGGC
jgi:hypothetical protein